MNENVIEIYSRQSIITKPESRVNRECSRDMINFYRQTQSIERHLYMNFLENIVGAIQVSGALVFSYFLRRWYNRWGATEAEVKKPLPGDELVPDPQMGYTRLVTINAAPQKIWPWLVQIGQGRGGLYSYAGLENLAGCQIRNTDRILPEHQNPQPGELIRLGPPGYPCFAIAAVEPPNALILWGADPKTEKTPEPGVRPAKGYSNATWQFILEPVKLGKTRLIARQRLAYSREMHWVWRITEPIGFVMERKMLLTIKKLAEKQAKAEK